MTPQEIVDYKNKWKMAAYFVVSVHTDFRSDIKDWCKEHCFQWRYDIKKFTENYTDSVSFELQEDYEAFKSWYLEKWRE
jgi:hypothetical protein|tara:strand:+ start:67 stop:303 length:237 start_codon:yes stop_codon:yes gene_type:complete